jgi:hypothetical protein
VTALDAHRDGYVRLRSAAAAAAPALLAYVGVRAVGLITLWIFTNLAGVDFWSVLNGRFDSNWYRQIADDGYDAAVRIGPDGTPAPSNLAFFPLYPALIALVTALTPFSSAVAGLVVSWLAGLAAAWGIYAVGEHLRDRTTGIVLAALWGALPHALVENLAYSEALFVALAAWSLLAVLRGRWLTAGTLCLLGGLTRPTASALVAAVGLAALVAAIRRRHGWRPWAALVLAPAGYLGYLAWVGNRLGSVGAYFAMQRESWAMSYDGGGDTARVLGRTLSEPSSLAIYVVALELLVALALLVLAIMDRLPWPLLVYSVIGLLLVVGTAGGFHGKGRYLLPLFPLLLPMADGLARGRRGHRIVVVVVLALVSAWYGTYLALDWGISP